MVTSELLSYLQSQLQAGISPDALRAVLLQAGWNPDDVEEGIKSAVASVPVQAPAMPVQPVQEAQPVMASAQPVIAQTQPIADQAQPMQAMVEEKPTPAQQVHVANPWKSIALIMILGFVVSAALLAGVVITYRTELLQVFRGTGTRAAATADVVATPTATPLILVSPTSSPLVSPAASPSASPILR